MALYLKILFMGEQNTEKKLKCFFHRGKKNFIYARKPIKVEPGYGNEPHLYLLCLSTGITTSSDGCNYSIRLIPASLQCTFVCRTESPRNICRSLKSEEFGDQNLAHIKYRLTQGMGKDHKSWKIPTLPVTIPYQRQRSSARSGKMRKDTLLSTSGVFGQWFGCPFSYTVSK